MNQMRKYQKLIAKWLPMHRMVPDDLDKVADAVKQSYERFRKVAYPNYHIDVERYPQTFWRWLAVKLIDNKIDPENFVALIFQNAPTLPHPGALLQRTAIQMYFKYMSSSDFKARIEREFAASVHKIRTWNDNGELKLYGLKKLLAAPETGFSDIFVWCMATHNGLDDVATDYRARARYMLMFPAYREVYGRAFPEEIDGLSG